MNQNMKLLNGLDQTKTVPLSGTNKQHPTADGLVDKAHRNAVDRGMYLVGMEILPLVVPDANLQLAVFKAVAHFRSEYEPECGVMSFSGIGDANPQNCTSAQTAAAYVRMAETRAVSRALSVALNVSEAVAEEMMASGYVAPAQAPQQYAQPGAAPQAYAQPAAPPTPGAPLRANGQPMIVYLKEHKGKTLNDPTLPVESLTWLANNAKLQDKITPDQEYRNACHAEISRRGGGFIANQVAPQPGYAPPPGAPIPAQFQPAPPHLPPAPVAYAAPPPPPAPPAQVAPIAGWTASAGEMQTLVTAAQVKGFQWDGLVNYVQTNFGGRAPQQLQQAEFNSVLAAFR